jgi:hypothetical protein
LDNPGLLRRPGIFPPATPAVHAFCDQLVEISGELRIAAVWIDNAGVVMVRLGGRGEHPNASAVQSYAEAIEEGWSRRQVATETAAACSAW